MKTYYFIILLLALSLFTTSCEKTKQEVVNDIAQVKEEPTKSAIVMDSVQWGIEELVGEKYGNIVCRSSADSPVFYILNSKNYALKEKFGAIGKASNEWIAPHFLFGNNAHANYIVDNGTKRIYTLEDFKESSKPRQFIKRNMAMNNLLLHQDKMFYINNLPNKTILYINEFRSNTPIDSIFFEDKTHKGLSYLDEFRYGVDDDVVVIGHALKDIFSIYRLTSNNKLTAICDVIGKGKVDENKYFYYSSVVIRNHKIYLLSQRHVDVAEERGASYIEVYDFAGKALKNYKLSFIASQMIKNSYNNNLLLLAADGTIQSVNVE